MELYETPNDGVVVKLQFADGQLRSRLALGRVGEEREVLAQSARANVPTSRGSEPTTPGETTTRISSRPCG